MYQVRGVEDQNKGAQGLELRKQVDTTLYKKEFLSAPLYNFQQLIIILIHLQRKTNNNESKNAKELDAM